MVLCLNKTDLVPTKVLDQWIDFFHQRFPYLHIATIGTLEGKRGDADALLQAISKCTVLKEGKTLLAESFVYPKVADVSNAHLNREQHVVVG